MKKRLLKKIYKRAEAENRSLRFEVYNPHAIVRICIESRPVGTLVRDVMVEIDDDRNGLREEIKGCVAQVLDAWNSAALEFERKRTASLVGQMMKMHELSVGPIVLQAPLAALADRMEGGDHA